MGFFDSAQTMLDKGVSTVQGAVSGVAVEQLGFVKDFVRLCNDGWNQGWHEFNGGNASYHLDAEEIKAAQPFFTDEPPAWQLMDVQVDCLAGAYFLVTAAGSHMRNVADAPNRNIGIVEMNDSGNAWRCVWGLKDGGVPTSEFTSHIINHAVKMQVTAGQSKVIYHSHPANIVALSHVLPLNDAEFSRALWKSMSECVMVFPEGIGVVPWMVPGSSDLAMATSQLMSTYNAVVWAEHGLFVAGTSFDQVFGLTHAIDKAAEVYLKARSCNGASDDFTNTISNDNLRAVAQKIGANLNESLLS